MNTPKRYWWLQIPEHYFDQKEFESLYPYIDGTRPILLYIRMMLLSLQDDGYLTYLGTRSSIHEEIGLQLHESNLELLKMTIGYFIACGKIELMPDGSLYMKEVVDLTGSESAAAERQRKHRERKKAIQEKVASGQVLVPVQPVIGNGLFGQMTPQTLPEDGEGLVEDDCDPEYDSPDGEDAEKCDIVTKNGENALHCHTYKEKDKDQYQYINKDEDGTVSVSVSEGMDTLSQTENTVSDMENTLSDEENTVSPPTIDEVREYCILNRLQTDPDKLYSYFDSGTWYENGKLRDWKRLADSNFYR